MEMQPFDVVFDNTFRTIVLVTPTNPVVECRQRGCYLTWLSKRGWPYWLFEGKITTDREVFDRGAPIIRAGVEQVAQKESGQLLTIRTAQLTRPIADLVSTVYDSSSVYMVLTDNDGVTYHLPVRVEPGRFLIWQDGQSRGTLDVTIKLPKIRSQRN